MVKKYLFHMPYGILFDGRKDGLVFDDDWIDGWIVAPEGWGMESDQYNPRSVINGWTGREYGPWTMVRL